MSFDHVGSSNFPDRPQYHRSPKSKRSRPNSADTRPLSIIAEDGIVPALPDRTHTRFFNRRWNFGDPPRHSFEIPPPKYSVWDATGPKGEKLTDVRENKHIARRGGWRRIFIIGIIFTATLVALIVGLVVGLRSEHSRYILDPRCSLPVVLIGCSNSSSSPPASSNSSASAANTFPAGSYTFTTFLDSVSTNCTSNTTDWSCAPYNTYSQSPSDAVANFTWIITASPWDVNSDYTISTSLDPFSINFSNVSLALRDQNSNTERYTFHTPVQKVVIPTIGVKCYYNETILEASLYTRRSKTYSAGSGTGSASTLTSSGAAVSSSDGFPAWEFAIEATELVGGGSNVPECYQITNGQKGNRITQDLVPQAAGEMCNCVYRNFNP